MSNQLSDFEKLSVAYYDLLAVIGGEDGIMDGFGLNKLPAAQKYGILFGCITFTVTLVAVVSLLILGGSFKRIKEQRNNKESTVGDIYSARKNRPLLLDELMEARKWLLSNYAKEKNPLTRVLLNDRPGDVPDLVEESSSNAKRPKYQENYARAYRCCQDKPGGAILDGVPEARFEAYARAYAGCGSRTSYPYRRSYARMYEAVACRTHATEKKFAGLFSSRPEDLVGRTVRLEALEEDRHSRCVFDATCGMAYLEQSAFDPDVVWGFLDKGPFESAEELAKSKFFLPSPRGAAFAVIENLTDRNCGCISLSHDDPENLGVQLEIPLLKPASHGTVEQLEACFLLLDRLFAIGYRRVQIEIDSMDVKAKKIPSSLGFTHEALMPKHKIINEASRDTSVYGMLNSDWNNGARAQLFKKLHGAKAQARDDAFDDKQEEIEDQLKEKNKLLQQQK